MSRSLDHSAKRECAAEAPLRREAEGRVRAELVGVTYRGVGAVTRAKVRLVLQSTDAFQTSLPFHITSSQMRRPELQVTSDK